MGFHFLLHCMKVKSESEAAQSCLTRIDPMDCSLPGSSIHGIFQARLLEWGAIAFSTWMLSSVAQSCLTLCGPMNHSTPGLPVHHQLLEFTQTHVHRVGDAIQPSHPSSVIQTHPAVPFSSCPQSLPASESFPMSQLFT